MKKSQYRASTNLLKNNLLYIVQRGKHGSFFEYYKLTTIPASLFKNNGLPKLTKYN